MSTQALASNVRVIEVHMDDSMRFSPSHIEVKQGEQGEITWQFENSGTLEFACLIPGHFEAGMKGSFEIN